MLQSLVDASRAPVTREQPAPVIALVTRVVDGDTFHAFAQLPTDSRPQDYTVRVRDIDAAEMRGRTRQERDAAMSSMMLLSALIRGTFVSLETQGSDKYGRLLARVRLPLRVSSHELAISWSASIIDATFDSVLQFSDNYQVSNRLLPRDEHGDVRLGCPTPRYFVEMLLQDGCLCPIANASTYSDATPPRAGEGLDVGEFMILAGAATRYDGRTKIDWTVWRANRPGVAQLESVITASDNATAIARMYAARARDAEHLTRPLTIA
jgi:endonuclease YncB( thermonuclease family)